jgi:predicted nucleic acid-binding protein
MNAVDTNILIYSIDAADERKRRRSLELLETLPPAETIIPWQVACEVAAVIRSMSNSGRFKGDFSEAVSSLRACFPIALPSISSLERSLRIQRHDQVSPWDALLIAASADAGVTRLYTEDLQGKRVIDGVEIVNPFL